jgi:hypothetical protein
MLQFKAGTLSQAGGADNLRWKDADASGSQPTESVGRAILYTPVANERRARSDAPDRRYTVHG